MRSVITQPRVGHCTQHTATFRQWVFKAFGEESLLVTESLQGLLA